MVERFAQLAEDAGDDIPRPLPQSETACQRSAAPAALYKLGLALDKPVAVFCPGAEYGPAKRWPVPYFAESRSACNSMAMRYG